MKECSIVVKKRTAVLVGVGAVVAIHLLKKVAKPVGAYMLGRGIIAYETACEAIESSGDVIWDSIGKIRRSLKRHPESHAESRP